MEIANKHSEIAFVPCTPLLCRAQKRVSRSQCTRETWKKGKNAALVMRQTRVFFLLLYSPLQPNILRGDRMVFNVNILQRSTYMAYSVDGEYNI
jgi:hypothetical protein